MHKSFFLVIVWFKNQIFSLFPVEEMNANYAEICSVSNLERKSVDFQHV